MKIKNVSALIKKANSGNPRSKAILGFAYWSGNSVKQDFKKAFSVWMELVKIDDPNGLFNIATMYFRGDGMKINYKKSHKYHLKCANLKIKKFPSCGPIGAKTLIRDSNYTLGENLYLQGKYKYNQKLGIKYMSKALDLGHFLSGYSLGGYFNPNTDNFYGIKKNIKKAIKYYELSAKYNFLPALVSLRDIYLKGVGIKRDFIKAKFYHDRAIKINNKKILKFGSQYESMLHLLKQMSETVRKEKFKNIVKFYRGEDFKRVKDKSI